MSLLSPDFYLASLSPGRAVLLKVRRGLRPALVEKQQLNVTPDAGAQRWRAELSALESLMVNAQKGLGLKVVISNHFVRFRIAPALPAMMKPAEAQGLLQHFFHEVYGDVVNEWEVRASVLPDGDTVPACAIDKSLLAGLRESSEKYGLRLRSVQPFYMAGYNAVYSRLGRGRSCFVQVETGRIQMAMLESGRWLSLNSVSAMPQWSEELPAMIEREALLAGWGQER